VDAAKLTTLAVGSTQMGVEAARHIEGLLLNCTTLMSFTYPNSRPQLAGTCHLCQGLAELSRTNHGLQHLNLQNCNLESQDDDAKSAVPWLAVFLKNSPHLKRLILRDCELTANGLKGILEAMVTSGAGLSVLDLGGNDRVGPAANNLGMFLSTQVITLRELIVETCNLSFSGIACLLAPFTDHQSVLRSLNLDDNDIRFLAARVIVNTFICSLDTLSVKHNPELPLEFALQLQKMYPKVKVDEDLQDEEQDLLIDEGDDLARAFGGLNMGV
jgi:Ran GTPase-activating protein (RanGAP) involved in mRNA processing and transport